MNPQIQQKVDEAIAFICGDVVSMAILWFHLDSFPMIMKIIITAACGLVGGITGLAGKDLYVYGKEKIKQWLEK